MREKLPSTSAKNGEDPCVKRPLNVVLVSNSSVYLALCFRLITFTLHLSHLADALIQSDLQIVVLLKGEFVSQCLLESILNQVFLLRPSFVVE
jgi:hypothetical protein